MQGRIGRAGGARVKRALSVQAILEWAFRVEKAQLELPVLRDNDGEGFGFGMEYVLIQRVRLGCKVDGGGHKSQSYTHQDAEIVAAPLVGMKGRRDRLGEALQPVHDRDQHVLDAPIAQFVSAVVISASAKAAVQVLFWLNDP